MSESWKLRLEQSAYHRSQCRFGPSAVWPPLWASSDVAPRRGGPPVPSRRGWKTGVHYQLVISIQWLWGSEKRSIWGIHSPYIFPITWGAVWSYLEFPNHLLVFQGLCWFTRGELVLLKMSLFLKMQGRFHGCFNGGFNVGYKWNMTDIGRFPSDGRIFSSHPCFVFVKFTSSTTWGPRSKAFSRFITPSHYGYNYQKPKHELVVVFPNWTPS